MNPMCPMESMTGSSALAALVDVMMMLLNVDRFLRRSFSSSLGTESKTD